MLNFCEHLWLFCHLCLKNKIKIIAPEQQMDLIVAEEDATQLESINLHPLTL